MGQNKEIKPTIYPDVIYEQARIENELWQARNAAYLLKEQSDNSEDMRYKEFVDIMTALKQRSNEGLMSNDDLFTAYTDIIKFYSLNPKEQVTKATETFNSVPGLTSGQLFLQPSDGNNYALYKVASVAEEDSETSTPLKLIIVENHNPNGELSYNTPFNLGWTVRAVDQVEPILVDKRLVSDKTKINQKVKASARASESHYYIATNTPLPEDGMHSLELETELGQFMRAFKAIEDIENFIIYRDKLIATQKEALLSDRADPSHLHMLRHYGGLIQVQAFTDELALKATEDESLKLFSNTRLLAAIIQYQNHTAGTMPTAPEIAELYNGLVVRGEALKQQEIIRQQYNPSPDVPPTATL